jgi:hypothetical protein
MAEPTWGLLKKAQDNEQLIDEAVAAAIAAHETDPDAHTGAGEALETHKSQETVDHPVGSVLADKESHSEEITRCVFESLDSWGTIGTVGLDELLGAKLYIEWGAVNLSELYGTVVYLGHFLNYAKDVMFQTTFWLDTETNANAYALLGNYVNDNNLEGFGFQIINGVVKGFWGDGADPTFTADLNINPETPHVYRAQYSAANLNVKFYVDGVLKATIENISPVGDFEPNVYFQYKATAATDGYMHVKNLTIARQA